ncbi:MAG: 2Fe-2S iron-sulfur cluster binding domain-containing protein [SAR324 cluster bacterium]|nr:2Fe-2S iron-sulfur cluster binding domain-containing protein [SAR324 cluster bacterium]
MTISIIIQSVGILIVLGVFVQIVLLMVSSFRRSFFEKEQFKRSIQLLDHQIESARNYRSLKEKEVLVWDGWRKFEVHKKIYECEDQEIFSLYLLPHDQKPLPPFKPGQYLTFRIQVSDRSKGDKNTVRCYSLSDSPNKDYYRVSIKRMPSPPDHPDAAPGKCSNYIHDSVQEGGIIDVKAPNGKFYLDTSRQSPVVLIGGGVGITPILSMLNTVADQGFNREVWLFYGLRNSQKHCMKDHLNQIAREHDNLHLHICYSRPLESDIKGEDYQHGQWITVDLFKRLLPSNNYDYYLCGPGPMMESLINGLGEWGVPDENIHCESFGPAGFKKGKKSSHLESTPDLEYQVKFSKSEQLLKWNSEAESLLVLGENNDISMDSGCRSGNCGTCLVAIKSGEFDYTTKPDYECEAGTMLTCCAIPISDIDIDA